ncbi:TPA: ATP-dependent Clp protease ATP-binding subunit [Staphylococcus aureus]|nr:ATP-dependent Clp protease ATP-binding subunit [Staphylococcus aureus]
MEEYKPTQLSPDKLRDSSNEMIQKLVENEFEKFNQYFGFALEYLDVNKPPVTGREQEIEYLKKYLSREDTPVVMLLGLAGAGKTALVESYGYIQQEKDIDIHLITVNIGALGEGEALRKRISTLLPKFKQYQEFLRQINKNCEVILFIDEAHHIVSTFGYGSKEGGELLKPYLARAGKYVKVIAATTQSEYDTYIATDDALKRRFKNIVLNEIDKDKVVKVLRKWLEDHEQTVYTKNVSDELLYSIVEANRRQASNVGEPAKSIDILESMQAWSRVDGRPLNQDLLNEVFKVATNVDLNFTVDVDKASQILRSRIRGQPLVLNVMNRVLKLAAFDTRRGDKPIAAILSAGTSGTGKTELAKSVAEALYGSDEKLINISMTDFNTPESAERFRNMLGKRLNHNPSTVVLFDEIEKAHQTVQLSLLPILGEGLVTYFDRAQDGVEFANQSSLRNAVVFATTNKGDEIFEKINNYNRSILDESDEDIDVLSKSVKLANRTLKPEILKALREDGFRPELLQRFPRILPFSTLSEKVLLSIADKKINDMIQYFADQGYDIRTNKPKFWGEDKYPYTATDLAMYAAIEQMQDKKNAGSRGARNIDAVVTEEIEGEILDVIADYPGVKKFSVTTNGNCVFEEGNSATSKGEIVVKPYIF